MLTHVSNDRNADILDAEFGRCLFADFRRSLIDPLEEFGIADDASARGLAADFLKIAQNICKGGLSGVCIVFFPILFRADRPCLLS